MKPIKAWTVMHEDKILDIFLTEKRKDDYENSAVGQFDKMVGVEIKEIEITFPNQV